MKNKNSILILSIVILITAVVYVWYVTQKKQINSVLSTPSESETVTIDTDSFIEIQPTESQIIIAKSENEEGFYIAADDYAYYSYLAHEFLEDKPIDTVLVTKRYIKFVSKDKTIYFDTQAESTGLWTTLIFSPNKSPKIINVIDIQSEYLNYFN